MRTRDVIKPWFVAAEETGEYIGIRYGHIRPGSDEPEWTFLRHTDVDGIGGFASILRGRGAQLCGLPQTRHASSPSRLAVLRMVPKFLGPRRRVRWSLPKNNVTARCSPVPPTSVAWHVFDESDTERIRKVSRQTGVTVNSFLLKHLTNAMRPDLENRSAAVPWMIPVNLRGKIARATDIENHSSYVSIKVGAADTAHDVHRNVYAALDNGEHWANWYAYSSSRLLTAGMRRFLIRTEKYMSQWHIGAFSNLGVWDAETETGRPDCEGSWLFCPPVLRCQHLGVGCVTYQRRLSLTIQAHPHLASCSETPNAWMRNWVREIDMS